MKQKQNPKVKTISLILVMLFALQLLPIYAAADEVSWTPFASMLVDNNYVQTASCNGKIYSIGGWTSKDGKLSSAEVYDPATNAWTKISSMVVPRSSFQEEVIGKKIYVIGGDSADGSLSSMIVYNTDTNAWTTLASMSDRRNGFQTAVIGEKIYAVGGNDYYKYNSKNLASAEVYDLATNKWTPLASMSVARVRFQLVVLGGKIYAIGGSDLKSAEVYDPTTDKWTPIASMADARAIFQTAVIDGKIYAIGGFNSTDKALSSIEVYDPATNKWTPLAPMSDARKTFQAEVIGGKIYVIGGANSTDKQLSSVQVYDPINNTWATLSSMLNVKDYYNSDVEVIDGKIYTIGYSDQFYNTGTIPNAPTGLTSTAGDTKITLNWTSVSNAASYNVYRSTTTGGTYTQIANGVTGTSYIDTGLTNNTTYYYVVTASGSSGNSSTYSNEASATPIASTSGVLLKITMLTGEIKEYNATSTVVENFINWFYGRATDCPVFKIEKTTDLGEYSSRTEYLAYEKISSFEILKH